MGISAFSQVEAISHEKDPCTIEGKLEDVLTSLYSLSSLGKLVRVHSGLDGRLDFNAPSKLMILMKDLLSKWSTNNLRCTHTCMMMFCRNSNRVDQAQPSKTSWQSQKISDQITWAI